MEYTYIYRKVIVGVIVNALCLSWVLGSTSPLWHTFTMWFYGELHAMHPKDYGVLCSQWSLFMQSQPRHRLDLALVPGPSARLHRRAEAKLTRTCERPLLARQLHGTQLVLASAPGVVKLPASSGFECSLAHVQQWAATSSILIVNGSLLDGEDSDTLRIHCSPRLQQAADVKSPHMLH